MDMDWKTGNKKNQETEVELEVNVGMCRLCRLSRVAPAVSESIYDGERSRGNLRYEMCKYMLDMYGP